MDLSQETKDESDHDQPIHYKIDLRDETVWWSSPDKDHVLDDCYDHGYLEILKHGVTTTGLAWTNLCHSS